jgi:hypothetical protein
VCGEEAVLDPGPTLGLLIQFEPSTAWEGSGRPTVAQLSRLPGLPAIAIVRQFCDDKDHVVWARPTSTTFWVVDLCRPLRVLVDLRHQDAESGSMGG